MEIRLADGCPETVRIVRRRRQRRIILHMDRDDGSFWLSAPFSAPEATIRRFLAEEGAEWMEARRKEYSCNAERGTIPLRGVEYPLIYREGPLRFTFTGSAFEAQAPAYRVAEWLFDRWWQDHALGHFETIAGEWLDLLPEFNGLRPQIAVRPLKNAWGTCYPAKQKIHLAAKLYAVSDSLMEYVILHELIHLLHPNHGPEFWAVVEIWMPDWAERRADLRRKTAEVSPLWPAFPSPG